MDGRHSKNGTFLKTGFTLIELSIVLVIIGLIIGGIVVGRDLISAATIRAQISQIEKYNSAVNTFRGKYGYLPGDIPEPYASQQGFAARGTLPGEGDGNGIIQGRWDVTWYAYTGAEMINGEVLAFWGDLTYANGMNVNMIEGSFPLDTPTTTALGNRTLTSSPSLYQILPTAKIGGANFVSVQSGGVSSPPQDGMNYFVISAITNTGSGWGSASPGMSVSQAYNIDRKIDDGFPQSGRVTALYVNFLSFNWAGVAPGTAAAPASSTCYDNGGNASNLMQYSMGQNNGAGLNCALSFRFQ